MELDRIRRRGVTTGRFAPLINRVRATLWRLLLPWLEGLVEDFGAVERRIDRLEAAGPQRSVVALPGAEAPAAPVDAMRADQRALAWRLGAIEERLGLGAPESADERARIRAWLDDHQGWLERLAAAERALQRRVEELEAQPVAVVQGAVAGAPVLAANPTGRFLVHPQDLIGRVVIGGREWEPHVARAMEAHARRDRIAVDVGAYVGLHTVRLARLFGHVHAFEPQGEIFRLLGANLALNDCTDAVTLHAQALWDRRCRLRLLPDAVQEVEMRRREGAVDYAEIRNAAALGFEPAEDESRPLDDGSAVDADTLDSHRLAAVGLLKIDAQGADLRVLRGAEATIRASRPVILFEFEAGLAGRHGDTLDDARRFLEALAYDVEVLAALRDDQTQADFIALPR